MEIAKYPLTPRQPHPTLNRLIEELAPRMRVLEASQIYFHPDDPLKEVVEVYCTSETPYGSAFHLVSDVDGIRDETVVMYHPDLKSGWREYSREAGELIPRATLYSFNPHVQMDRIRRRCCKANEKAALRRDIVRSQ